MISEITNVNLLQPAHVLTGPAIHENPAGPPINAGDNDIHHCAISLHMTGELVVDETLTDEDFSGYTTDPWKFVSISQIEGDWMSSSGVMDIALEGNFRGNGITDNYVCELALYSKVTDWMLNRATLQDSDAPRYIRVGFDHSGRAGAHRRSFYYDMEVSLLTFDDYGAGQTLADARSFDFYALNRVPVLSRNYFSHTYPVSEYCREIHTRFEHAGPHTLSSAGAVIDNIKVEQLTVIDHRSGLLTGSMGQVYQSNGDLRQLAGVLTGVLTGLTSYIHQLDSDLQQPAYVLEGSALHENPAGPPINAGDNDVHHCAISLHMTGELVVDKTLTDENFSGYTTEHWKLVLVSQMEGDWMSSSGRIEIARETVFRNNGIINNFACEFALYSGKLGWLLNRATLQDSDAPKYIRVGFDHSGRIDTSRQPFYYDMEVSLLTFDDYGADQTLADAKSFDFYALNRVPVSSRNYFSHTYPVSEYCREIHTRFEHTGPYLFSHEGAVIDNVKVEQLTVIDHRSGLLTGSVGHVYQSNGDLRQLTGVLTGVLTSSTGHMHQLANDLQQPAYVLTGSAGHVHQLANDLQQPAYVLTGSAGHVHQLANDLQQPAYVLTSSAGHMHQLANDLQQPAYVLTGSAGHMHQLANDLQQPAYMLTGSASHIHQSNGDLRQPVHVLESFALHGNPASLPINAGDNDVHHCAISLHMTGELVVDETLTDEDFSGYTTGERKLALASQIEGDWISSSGVMDIAREGDLRGNDITDNYVCELALYSEAIGWVLNRATLQDSDAPRYIRVGFDHSGRVDTRRRPFYYDMEVSLLTFDDYGAGQTLADTKSFDFYALNREPVLSRNYFSHTYPVSEYCREIHTRFEHAGPYAPSIAGALIDNVKVEQLTVIDHRSGLLTGSIGQVYQSNGDLRQPAGEFRIFENLPSGSSPVLRFGFKL
ncbi:MAG: hypothetical protein N0E48_15990 [Candidatus Thiodiazotropha endolucinida]|nr:hypothetical protein [Candidatus Thiodiazotropha taylori]MCW4344832.1 hypothetical protein [Candidatus Thiodiazotropha endolucinida]